MLNSLVGHRYIQKNALGMEGDGIEADHVFNVPLLALALGVFLVKDICQGP
jgi:hypothetical protein